jgi:UDP-GlcNAc3NAcA epimerase
MIPMKKILTVLGARPQFIKASVVSHALRETGVLGEVLVHTGQHFDANMSEVFFAELGMAVPVHHLGIHGGGHGAMTGQMLIEVERVLLAERPDAVLVYGDTNSTLAGALAAVKLHIPVAHVEAGLRSFNLAMPEEVNRILTDRVSRWLFTPTQAAQAHLQREGVAADRIVPVGDVMYDVALHHGARVDAGDRMLGALGLTPRGYVLATVHRAENTDHPQRLAAIVDALEAVAQRLPVVWPLHPRTRGVLQREGRLARLSSRVRLIDPVGYLDMVQLERQAAVVATDSGGVQKEAFFHRVPCVTLRDETEWVELVEAGWNRLAPPQSAQAVSAAVLGAVGTLGADVQPYGDGQAASRIVQRLRMDLGA